MKFPSPLKSHMYGDPADHVKFESEKAAKNPAASPTKRPTLTLKRRAEGEWSKARKAAEALFEVPHG
jgi:hypothetical protein